MFCGKCGFQVADNARVCSNCGAEIKARLPMNSNNHRGIDTQYNSKTEKNNQNLKIIIAILVIVMILIIGLGVCFLIIYNINQGDNVQIPLSGGQSISGGTNINGGQTPPPAQKVNPSDELKKRVDSMVSSYNLNNSVAVAVESNDGNVLAYCTGAYDTYTAWGFYLPIYMALCDKYPNEYAGYKNDIMSSNVAVCNNASNNTISLFGGTDSITRYIRSNFSCYSTSIGRKFGAPSSSGNNYTSAADAVGMLRRFNNSYYYTDLHYKPSDFGIGAAYGADMYCHIGTEDITRKNDLNLFAVVKGNTSDYSIVIMTRNKASATGIINAILHEVHTYMEGLK